MPKRKRNKSPNLDLLEDGFDDELDSNDDKPGTPIQRNAANARERARMRVLSKAFFNLKRNIPWVPVDTKLSKLDTLRLAKNYISYLAATLDGQSVEDFSSNLAQPPKTAWPFIFQPVQAHEPSKPKLVPVSPANSSSMEKWPNIARTGSTTTAPSTTTMTTTTTTASPSVESHIKSQHFAPSSINGTNGTSAAANGGTAVSRSFVTDESNFGESRALSLEQHHHHQHHQTIVHHMQQHSHHHHGTGNHLHGFHHHHAHLAMSSD